MNYFSKLKKKRGGKRLSERFGMKINCSKGLRKAQIWYLRQGKDKEWEKRA